MTECGYDPDLWTAIGNLIDHWEGLPNDLRGSLDDDCPNFVSAMRRFVKAVERADTP